MGMLLHEVSGSGAERVSFAADTTVITPEIQATVRDGKRGPAKEFYKTLAVAYAPFCPSMRCSCSDKQCWQVEQDCFS